MKCQSLMIVPPVILAATATVAEAAAAFVACRQNALPVAETDGRYVGTVTMHHLIGLVLPRAAIVASSGQLPDIGFMSDSLDDLRSRLGERANEPVRAHLTPDDPAVRPDTEIAEALLLLYRGHGFVAVVDEQDRLTGIVTGWDAMGRVVGGE